MVVYSILLRCVDPILVVVGSHSVRNPFLSPAQNRQLAKEARKQISGDVLSDQLALIRAYNEFVLKLVGSRQEVSSFIFLFFFVRSLSHT